MSDLAFKALTFSVLTPLVSLLFVLFLAASGRTVLADVDIAYFLVHPIGWIAFILVGGCILCVFALELAILMTICLGVEQGKKFFTRHVILFVATNAFGVLRLTSRIVARTGMLAVPFLGVGGGLYWLLLTDRDINYYLTTKPFKFWLAGALIGCVLLTMFSMLLRQFSGWAFATQLLLFEKLSPREALIASERRSIGHRGRIAGVFLIWLMVTSAFSFFVSLCVVKFGQAIVPLAASQLWTLMIALGTVIVLVSLSNLLCNMFGNLTLASILAELYLQIASSQTLRLPEVPQSLNKWLPLGMSRGRVLVASGVAILFVGFLGATAIHQFDLEDRVQITAHRGGAGVAPENTLAAISKAIQDGTDWVEIDVQESSDGVVLVAHDSDLAKVAKNPTKIWAATAEEIRSIDIGSYFDSSFSDQRVPTLDEVLSLCKGKTRVNIELKYYGHTQDLENRVVELVERHGMASEIVIMSLEARGIAKMKSLRPDWKVGLLTAVAAGDVTRAKADFLAVNSSLASRKFVRLAHARGKAVSVWTVNDAASLSVMTSRGVDNLITDYPALAREVLAERSQMSLLERLLIETAFYLGVKPRSVATK